MDSRHPVKHKCEDDFGSPEAKKTKSSEASGCRDRQCLEGNYVIVREPRMYNGDAHFGEIYQIGSYSVDEQGHFSHTQSKLKFLHLPQNTLNTNLDLKVGYGHEIKKDVHISEKLDMMLRWILCNKDKFSTTDSNSGSSTLLKRLPADFFCFRGLLTKIFITPYEKRDDWIILASKFKGTIYLHAIATDRQIEERLNMSDKHRAMCAWGFKFEQYLTKSNPNGLPEPPETPVNEKEEFCAVFRSKLNNNTLLYGAEIDGAITSSTNREPRTGVGRYMELKTSTIITTEYQDIAFCKNKTMKWWAQCFLASISKLYCGFRDEDGIVRYIRGFNIPELSAIGKGLWSPKACINFTDCFLSFVKKKVIKDDPNVVYRFQWNPKISNVCSFRELDQEESLICKFLPEWYTSEFQD